jgi:hypothetical protein
MELKVLWKINLRTRKYLRNELTLKSKKLKKKKKKTKENVKKGGGDLFGKDFGRREEKKKSIRLPKERGLCLGVSK